MELMFAQ
jgi:hypothetical protein